MTNLYDIGRWYANRGLVGEVKLALVQTIVAISGKPIGFGIEAPSGSGKSATMDLLTGHKGKDNGLIKEEYIYFKDAGSATSMFYDAPLMNRAKIIIFAELQKDKSDTTVEAIKSMTEGKKAQRNVTDMKMNGGDGGIKEQAIEPKTVLYTLAIENDHKPDTELRRRCVVMTTDISKSQTDLVLETKAKTQWDANACKILTDEEEARIRKDVNTLFRYNFEAQNPFAEEFAKEIAKIAPDQKVRSTASHFWNVMSAVTLSNFTERIMVGDFILSNIQDLIMTLEIYGDAFIRDVYGIPPMGDVVLQGFKDAAHVDETVKESTVKAPTLANFGAEKDVGGWYDVNHIRKAIKEKQNVVLKKNVVLQICRQLVDAGYLEDDRESKVVKFQVQDKFKTFDEPDVMQLIKVAYEKVKAKYPDKADKWYEQQFQPFQHPITGEVIKFDKPSALDDMDDGGDLC